MSKVVILCEGNADSIDKKILTQLLPPKGQIRQHEPLGGKYGSPAFIKGYMARGGVGKPQFAVCLRDRDFDFAIQPDHIPRLLERPDRTNGDAGIYIYATYRAAMENYLLNPDLLAQFLKKDRQEVEKIVAESARSIAHYSAIRHALGKLRKPLGFGTTWMREGSGHLPDAEMLASEERCFEKGWSLVSNFRTETDAITRDALREYFDHFQNLFSEPDFWATHRYLAYFHGKDLQKAIGRMFDQKSTRSLGSWADFHDFAIKNTDFTAFDDLRAFKELVEKLEQ